MTFEGSTGETRILVIEDDIEVTEIVDAFLSTAGYRVAVERQAQEGITRIETFNPHLIILNAAMPGMDGHEVQGVLKQNPSTAKIPIVFLTDKNTPIDSRDGMFVRKPFSCERLLDFVRVALLATYE